MELIEEEKRVRAEIEQLKNVRTINLDAYVMPKIEDLDEDDDRIPGERVISSNFILLDSSTEREIDQFDALKTLMIEVRKRRLTRISDILFKRGIDG